MRRSIVPYAGILAPALALAFAPPPPSASDCPGAVAALIPSWTVNNLNLTYSAVNDGAGTAWFTLGNTVTNTTESLTCRLLYNSLCTIDGTPADKKLQLKMQINMDMAFVSVNQTVTCENSSPAYIVGMAEIWITCPAVHSDDMVCVGEPGVIKGTLLTD